MPTVYKPIVKINSTSFAFTITFTSYCYTYRQGNKIVKDFPGLERAETQKKNAVCLALSGITCTSIVDRTRKQQQRSKFHAGPLPLWVFLTHNESPQTGIR